MKYSQLGFIFFCILTTSIESFELCEKQNLSLSSDKVTESSLTSKAKRLLEWNREKLTSHSKLDIKDLKELFAKEFVVIANGRKYDANYQSYYEFLNKFRSDIASIDYQVQEYLNAESVVIMPLKAVIKKLSGNEEVFDAILIVKFNDSGKIVHWQEVYVSHTSF